MSTSKETDKNLMCHIYENDSSVIASCSYTRQMESKENTNEISDLKYLSKVELEELLIKQKTILDSQEVFIQKAMESYTADYVQYKNLENELESIQLTNKMKHFLDENESNFNQLINESNDNAGKVYITNGLYVLKITYEKQENNYNIHFVIGIHDIVSGNMYEDPIDCEDLIFSDIEQVQLYIENKLRIYNHLFIVKKAIMFKHLGYLDRIHKKFLPEFKIIAFDNKEDILEIANKLQSKSSYD